jgi:hypothetical protein
MAHVATVTIPAAASTLTDFPVTVTPDNAAAWVTFWSTVTASGGDIRVYLDDDTTELPREVVALNVGAETGEIHILVPTVSSSAATDIHIHADGSSSEPAADSTFGSEAVWADYDGVYHLENPGTSVVDSSGTNADGTNDGGADATGQIGEGVEFNGTGGHSINLGTGLDNLWSGGATFSLWARIDSVGASAGRIFQSQAGGTNGWLAFVVNESGSNVDVRLNSQRASANGVWQATTTLGTRHLAFTYNDDTLGADPKIYSDGSSQTVTEVTTPSGSPGSDAANNKVLGNTAVSGTNEFDGVLDEVRFRRSILSADWIAYEHANQDDPAGWYSVAAVGGGVTSEGDQTLAAITQAGTGSAETVGTAAQTLSALSQAGSGTLTVPGAGAQVLAAITQAGEGAHTTTAEGAGDQTIAALTQAGDGTHTLAATATGDQTLAALTQAGAAEQILSGTAAQVMAAMQQAGAGLETITTTGVQIIAALTQVAAAALEHESTGAQNVPAPEQHGDGTHSVAVEGSGAQTIQALEQASEGVHPQPLGKSGVNRLALSEQHATTARTPSLADVGRRREELRARSDDVQLRAPVQPGDFVDPESGAIVRAPRPSKSKVEARAPAVTTPGLGIDAPLPDDDIAELRELLGKAEARRRKMMTAALLLYYAEAA